MNRQQDIRAAESPADTCFLADARSMLEIPDGSVQLIVTSPPYFNIKDYSLDGRQRERHAPSNGGQLGDVDRFDAFIESLLEVWEECARVLSPNGKLVINAPLMPMLKKEMSTHENRHIFDLNAEIQNSLLRNVHNLFLMDTYIWNRTNPTKRLMFGSYPSPTNFYAQNTCEFISVYVKAGKRSPVPKSVKEASALTQEEWLEFTRQVWDIPIPPVSDPAFGKHAAIMPAEIARRCIRLYSFVGDTVLDPFAGSGTTLKAAKDLDRHFLGYEVVPTYGEVIDHKLGDSVCQVPERDSRDGDGRGRPENNAGLIPESLLDQVMHKDALDLLSELPPQSVPCVIVDPPYNLGKADWDTWPDEASFRAFTCEWLAAAYDVLVPGGNMCVFNTPRNAAWMLEELERLGAHLQNWITWDKRDGFSATTRRFVPMQETILYVTRPGGRHTFNADDIRIPYESTSRIKAAERKGIIKNGKRWFPNPLGRMPSDVWHFPSDRHIKKQGGKVQKNSHPTPKPEALVRRLVLATSNPGDVVLDCFVGTGTTALVAKECGRRFIASDSDEDSVALARERFREFSGDTILGRVA